MRAAHVKLIKLTFMAILNKIYCHCYRVHKNNVRVIMGFLGLFLV